MLDHQRVPLFRKVDSNWEGRSLKNTDSGIVPLVPGPWPFTILLTVYKDMRNSSANALAIIIFQLNTQGQLARA